MFTGIIEEIGTIRSVQKGSRSFALTVAANIVLEDLRTGDSINTNGVCLTVVSFNQGAFTADIMPETMRKTSMKNVKPGSLVNLERAATLNKRLGGHLVSGHIDGTGTVHKRWEEDNAVWLMIDTETHILKYIVTKGSVALDGISLTVVAVDERSFTVSIIPHTQNMTTILRKKPGDLMNIECDIIAKYLEKLNQPIKHESKIDLDFLAQNDFI